MLQSPFSFSGAQVPKTYIPLAINIQMKENLNVDLHHHHHDHVPGLLQTSAIMAFQPSLSSVLLMSSLLGDSYHCYEVIQTVYFVRCLPLLLVPQTFPLNICFSSPTALFVFPKNCSCLFLMVLSRDLLYPVISITSWFYFFSVHDIVIIVLMYHISAASSLLSRSVVSVHPSPI